MSRSRWKGFFIAAELINLKKNSLKIWNRSSLISEYFLGKSVKIYNGKDFNTVTITREKLGFKFGEFSFTRKMYERVKKKKKIKKNK